MAVKRAIPRRVRRIQGGGGGAGGGEAVGIRFCPVMMSSNGNGRLMFPSGQNRAAPGEKYQ